MYHHSHKVTLATVSVVEFQMHIHSRGDDGDNNNNKSIIYPTSQPLITVHSFLNFMRINSFHKHIGCNATIPLV
jgi:hypothetical protein